MCAWPFRLSALRVPRFMRRLRQIPGRESRARPGAGVGVVEELETRSLLSLTFQFDYRYDRAGYFRDPARRKILELAGRLIADRIDTHLAAIIPEHGRSWSTWIKNPETHKPVKLKDLRIHKDRIIIFPGSAPKSAPKEGEKAGLAFTVPDYKTSALGDSAWKRTVYARGIDTGTGGKKYLFPRIASLSITRGYAYHFGVTTAGLSPSRRDFLTVAVHELGHAIGLGTSDLFMAKVETYLYGVPGVYQTSRSYFHATSLPSPGLLPLDVSKDNQLHWARDQKWEDLAPALTPQVVPNDRHLFSGLDRLAVREIGFAERNDNQNGGANDTLTTAEHVLTARPGEYHEKHIDEALDRSRDVDIYSVYGTAGTVLNVLVPMMTGDNMIDPTIRVFDLAGKQYKRHVGGTLQAPTEPSMLEYKTALQLTLPRTDYYFVAISAAGNTEYDPLRAESGTASATRDYSISIGFGDSSQAHPPIFVPPLVLGTPSPAHPSGPVNESGTDGTRISHRAFWMKRLRA